MKAAKYSIVMMYGGKQYFFNDMKISVLNKTEDSATVDGGLYRVRSAASGESVYLKGRIEHTDIFVYRELLKELAGGQAKGLTINMKSFDGWTLQSGRVVSSETESFSICELTLTKTEN